MWNNPLYHQQPLVPFFHCSDWPFCVVSSIRPRSKGNHPPSCASLTQVKFHLFFTQMASIDATQLAGKRWPVIKTMVFVQFLRVEMGSGETQVFNKFEDWKTCQLVQEKKWNLLSQLIKKRSVKVARWLKAHWYFFQKMCVCCYRISITWKNAWTFLMYHDSGQLQRDFQFKRSIQWMRRLPGIVKNCNQLSKLHRHQTLWPSDVAPSEQQQLQPLLIKKPMVGFLMSFTHGF